MRHRVPALPPPKRLRAGRSKALTTLVPDLDLFKLFPGHDGRRYLSEIINLQQGRASCIKGMLIFGRYIQNEVLKGVAECEAGTKIGLMPLTSFSGCINLKK